MNTIIIVGIIFGSIIAIAGLLCGTILLLVRGRKMGFTAKDKQASADEALMIQEIYSGLEKMEQRIESLETILMDRQDAGDEK